MSNLLWPPHPTLSVQPSPLSKKEVEDLLKKGAYGALLDEDDDANKWVSRSVVWCSNALNGLDVFVGQGFVGQGFVGQGFVVDILVYKDRGALAL